MIPYVRPKASDPSGPAAEKRLRLDWIEIVRYNKPAGEVLAAFELLQESPQPPPQNVPEGIRPTLQRTRIEVLSKI